MTQSREERRTAPTQPSASGSYLVDAARALPARTRSQMGLSDTLLAFAEVVVVGVRSVVDDDDYRSVEEKVLALQPRLEELDLVAIEAWMDQLAAKDADDIKKLMGPWIARFTKPGGRRFLLRLTGSQHYARLKQAAQLDGAILAVAVRRGMRTFLPLAAALDDLALMLKPEELERFEGFSAVEHVGLRMLSEVDGLLEKVFKWDLPLADLPLRADERSPLEMDMPKLAEKLRPLVSAASLERVEGLSEALHRKLRGASYALENSPDGVSQAANSLVEFIDRLVREAFTPREILAWAEGRYPDKENRQESNLSRPSKRAQVRCFVYGGQPGQVAPMYELASSGLLSARDRLQKIKHADRNTEQEREELRQIIRAIEGFFLFAFRLGWSLQDDASLERLRARLNIS